jgi:anthranilate/para-aminobenzoate synthase component II
MQFATQNYTQTNKKCEELLHKIIFFDLVVWKISKIATYRKKVILSPDPSWSKDKYWALELTKDYMSESHIFTICVGGTTN